MHPSLAQLTILHTTPHGTIPEAMHATTSWTYPCWCLFISAAAFTSAMTPMHPTIVAALGWAPLMPPSPELTNTYNKRSSQLYTYIIVTGQCVTNKCNHQSHRTICHHQCATIYMKLTFGLHTTKMAQKLSADIDTVQFAIFVLRSDSSFY